MYIKVIVLETMGIVNNFLGLFIFFFIYIEMQDLRLAFGSFFLHKKNEYFSSLLGLFNAKLFIIASIFLHKGTSNG